MEADLETETIVDVENVLTVDDLTSAIRNSIDREGMDAEAARDMALHVLHFFGFSDRIIDNVLEPEDRDAFYMLEDSGLLVTEREETTLYDGREWRIHFWMFRRDRIAELVRVAKARTGQDEDSSVACYTEVPDDVWARLGADDSPTAPTPTEPKIRE